MKIIGIENHQWKDKYPCRLPVWWGNVGEIGAHPNVSGVTGRKVVLRIEKLSRKLSLFFLRLIAGAKGPFLYYVRVF